MHPPDRDGAWARQDPRSRTTSASLYELIWKRTIASQMAAARMERTAVDIASPDGQVGFRANGQVMLFDGFLKVYDEGRDEEGEDEGRLPQVIGQRRRARCEKRMRESRPDQHFHPTRRRAIPRRRWSSGWRNWGSGGPRPMPRS